MRNKLKSYSLVLCLFVFLFVIIGGGLHLNPIGAFAAALSATPLILHTVNRWGGNPAQDSSCKKLQDINAREMGP